MQKDTTIKKYGSRHKTLKSRYTSYHDRTKPSRTCICSKLQVQLVLRTYFPLVRLCFVALSLAQIRPSSHGFAQPEEAGSGNTRGSGGAHVTVSNHSGNSRVPSLSMRTNRECAAPSQAPEYRRNNLHYIRIGSQERKSPTI